MTTAPPRPPFRVSGTANIKHLNVRKEGPEDEKVLAVDVKLSIAGVDRRLCAYFDEALEPFLWRGETDALIARNAFLVPVAYANIIENCIVIIGGDEYRGCEVRKFSVDPRDGGVMTLCCTVTLAPSSNEVAALARMVQDDISVSIESPLDLFTSPAAGKSEVVLTLTGKTSEQIADLLDESAPDPMIETATALVRLQDKASISLVQRHLKIGYSRAARLIEQMEANGVVSAMAANGSRTVLEAAS